MPTTDLHPITRVALAPFSPRGDHAGWHAELEREINSRTECSAREINQATDALQRCGNAIRECLAKLDAERDNLRIATNGNAMSPAFRLRDVMFETLMDELDLMPEAAHLLAGG